MGGTYRAACYEEDNLGWQVSKKKSSSKAYNITNHTPCITNTLATSFNNTFSVLQNLEENNEVEEVLELHNNNKITISIAGLQTECLIDSGSTISLISTTLYIR